MADEPVKTEQEKKLEEAAELVKGGDLPVPRNDMVLVLPESEESMRTTEVFITEEERVEPVSIGIVLAVGRGKILEAKSTPLGTDDIFPGDRVIYRSRGGTQFPWKGKLITVVVESFVFVVLERQVGKEGSSIPWAIRKEV